LPIGILTRRGYKHFWPISNLIIGLNAETKARALDALWTY
jgi:hypothetical protein